jgi:hypothetical protein
MDARDLELRNLQLEPENDPWVNPPHSLRIVIPFIPPSSNHIYVTDWRRKIRFKTAEAKAFEFQFFEEVVPKYLPWLSQMDDVEKDDSLIFAARLDFFFPMSEVLNKGFLERFVKGKKKGQRKAKTRYKKMDTGNRFKLVDDCLARMLGVDDSHFWDTGGRKFIAEAFDLTPQVHIYLTKQDPSYFGATIINPDA